MSVFIFCKDEAGLDRRCRCITVPHDAAKEELLAALADRLNFPGYFGKNWDALSDCLSDLEWVGECVTLWHPRLPALSEHELRKYLTVLYHSAAGWLAEPQPKLCVAFIESLRTRVTDLTDTIVADE